MIRRALPTCLLAFLLATALVGTAQAVPEPLTLRVNDGAARPGGVLAVVLRTYSPRGVGQGQVCFFNSANFAAPERAVPNGAGPEGAVTLTELIEARVFSDGGDAVVSADFNVGTQELMLDFSSLSASINLSDGPMIALLFRVSDQAMPGATFTMSVDESVSFLLDGEGQPIEIAPRPGEMTIDSPLAAYEVDAEGGDAAAGMWSESGVSTIESLPLSGGTVVFLYDPAVVDGTPDVFMSSRYGTSTVDSVDFQAGRVAVTFSSADDSLNRIPGDIVTIRLPIADGVTIGETSPVSLESGTTQLFDADGLPLTLVLGDDQLQFVHRHDLAMFYDGFESSDFSQWCVVVGGV